MMDYIHKPQNFAHLWREIYFKITSETLRENKNTCLLNLKRKQKKIVYQTLKVNSEQGFFRHQHLKKNRSSL